MTDNLEEQLKEAMGEEAYNDMVSALKFDERKPRSVEEIMKNIPRSN